MKFVKLLTVPVVLLMTVLMAVPALAHTISSSTIDTACGTGNDVGKICVTIGGTVESDLQERFVFMDIFASGAEIKPSNSLGEVVFDIKPDSKLPMKMCFDKFQSTATSFTVAIMKVTSDQAGKNAADIKFAGIKVNGQDFKVNGKVVQDLIFDVNNPGPAALATGVAQCATTPPPNNSGSGSGTTTTASPAATTVALAQTGGFDFRFPLIGLVLLVIGGALFVVSASRRRSPDTK